MAIYSKTQTVQGQWIKAAELTTGTKAKIVSETQPQESVFEGKTRTQNVAKIKIQGQDEIKNVNINKTTINGLIDAFGEDSRNWIDKVLKIQTEKTLIAGKRITVLYLLPEGYELSEDGSGYLVVQKIGLQNAQNAPETQDVEEVDADDIPF